MSSNVLLHERPLKPVFSVGIPVPPLLCPDKGYFCLISIHYALPFNLAVGRAQSHRLKMNAVADIAGRIGDIGEVVLVTGGGDKSAIAEDNLFSLIGVELLAFLTIETSKRFPIQKMRRFRGKCGINK